MGKRIGTALGGRAGVVDGWEIARSTVEHQRLERRDGKSAPTSTNEPPRSAFGDTNHLEAKFEVVLRNLMCTSPH